MNGDIFTLIWMIGFYLMTFVAIIVRNKEQKKNQRLKADYDDLVEQIKILTHENNILKNQSADTK